jgi:hypothetical protein
MRKIITAKEILEGIESTALSFSQDAREFCIQWLKGGGLDIQEDEEILNLLSDPIKKELWETISVVEDDILFYRGDQLDPKTTLEIQRDYLISDLYDRAPQAKYEVWTQNRMLAVDQANATGSGVVYSTYILKEEVIVAARDVDWLFNPNFLLDDRFLVEGKDRRCELEEIIFNVL